jgi:hypothetical protein
MFFGAAIAWPQTITITSLLLLFCNGCPNNRNFLKRRKNEGD